MKNTKLNFEDFQIEQLSVNQQKSVRGGDGTSQTPPTEPNPTDPGKGGTTTTP